MKICLSLKPHHTINKFNQVKIVQILDIGSFNCHCNNNFSIHNISLLQLLNFYFVPFEPWKTIKLCRKPKKCKIYWDNVLAMPEKGNNRKIGMTLPMSKSQGGWIYQYFMSRFWTSWFFVYGIKHTAKMLGLTSRCVHCRVGYSFVGETEWQLLRQMQHLRFAHKGWCREH